MSEAARRGDASDAPTTTTQGTRRLFVAVIPDDGARAELVRTQRALGPSLRHPHATSAGNLHLTLAFLGGLDGDGEEGARRAMVRAARAFGDGGGGAFSLALGPVGSFDRGRGSVVWRGVSDVGNGGYRSLLRLQALLARELAGTGLHVDERPFSPHITLFRGCRVKAGATAVPAAGSDGNARERHRVEMRELLARANAELGGRGAAREAPMAVDAMSLMWSHHPAGGVLTYTELFRVGL